jgi:hypothetical protein
LENKLVEHLLIFILILHFLNQGISCDYEKFQAPICEFLKDCKGGIIFFVAIVGYETIAETFDARLTIVLNRLEDKGFTLNSKKCKSGNNWILFAKKIPLKITCQQIKGLRLSEFQNTLVQHVTNEFLGFGQLPY